MAAILFHHPLVVIVDRVIYVDALGRVPFEATAYDHVLEAEGPGGVCGVPAAARGPQVHRVARVGELEEDLAGMRPGIAVLGAQGVKDVEERSRPSAYRFRPLIHSLANVTGRFISP